MNKILSTAFLLLNVSLSLQAHAQTEQLPTDTLAKQLGVEPVNAPKTVPTVQSPAGPSVVTRSLNKRSAMKSAQSKAPNAPAESNIPTALITTTSPAAETNYREFKPQTLRTESRSWRVNINLGYVHSDWKGFSKKLSQGSTSVSVGFAAYLNDYLELGVDLQSISGMSKGGTEDNVHAELLKPVARFSFNSESQFNPWAGIGLAMGTYRVWRITNDTSSARSYRKLGSGNVFGAEAQAGMEFKISPRFSADIILSYLAILDNPAYRIGGVGAHLGLGFIY